MIATKQNNSFQMNQCQFRSDDRTCPEVGCLTYQASSVKMSLMVFDVSTSHIGYISAADI